MKKLIAIAALTLSLAPYAEAQPAPGPSPPLPPPSAAIGAGPWIVGGIGLSALSVIAYAAVINGREHRELTSAEAIGAMVLPFGWLLNPAIYQTGNVTWIRPGALNVEHPSLGGVSHGAPWRGINPNATMPPR